MIRKVGKKYKVISHRTGKSLGTYSTRIAAEERLRQIQRFKKNG